MDKDKTKKRIEELRDTIRRADYRYYGLSDPELSDKEYDDLIKELKELEGKNPGLITPDSPTQRVSGGVLEGFATVKHNSKMLSLENTYSIDELREWEDKIKRVLKKDIDLDYFSELKIDGVSAALTYREGRLITGATRGDGESGEDVTANIKTIKSMPLRFIGRGIPKLIEIRGEVYIGIEDFKKINQERLSAAKPLFVNPRNSASGSLKLLEPSLVAERNLRYFVHSLGVVRGVNFTAQQDFLRKCGQWGLCLNPYSKYCKDLKEAIDFCLFWQDRKGKLDYQVDGVVVKVNSFTLQEKLGSTHKSPRWAVAYKFPAHQATTRVKKIEFGVGRTGIITPTAILVPVECGGVTISRATLHNFDEIKRLGIKEGDTVLLERAGEVIPKIIKVITSKRTGRERAVKVPVICPVCGSDVEKEKDEEVYWYCLNPDCPAQLKRSLLHFASRGAMDIEGMGAAVIEELVNRNMVKKHSDIYALKKDDFLKLPFFKDKRAKNLVSAIDKSKNRPLSRFLFGLGIKHVGEKAALVLARKFNNIDIFFKLKDSDLERLAEVGPVMASSIVKFFSSRNSRKMIEEFRRAGVNFPPLKPAAKESRITGKSFVFTGELNSLSRSQAKKLVESSGGKWVSAVSKNSDFLVAGKNPGSKYAKAEQLGVNILAEKDFLALLD